MTEQLKVHRFDFMPTAQTEHNLWRRACVQIHTLTLFFFLCHQPPGTHLNTSPLLPTSLHFPLFLTDLLLSSIILWGNRRGSFFLSFFDTRSACSCIPLAASFCLKWTLHTVTGLTIHCWAHSLHTKSDCPPARTLTHKPAQIWAQEWMSMYRGEEMHIHHTGTGSTWPEWC